MLRLANIYVVLISPKVLGLLDSRSVCMIFHARRDYIKQVAHELQEVLKVDGNIEVESLLSAEQATLQVLPGWIAVQAVIRKGKAPIKFAVDPHFLTPVFLDTMSPAKTKAYILRGDHQGETVKVAEKGNTPMVVPFPKPSGRAKKWRISTEDLVLLC
jgi:hypothetical protein